MKEFKNKKHIIIKNSTLSLFVATILAALPVAGVFAADPWDGSGIMKHEDELRINVLPICTLGELETEAAGKGLAIQYEEVQDNTTGDFANITVVPKGDAGDDATDHASVNGTWTEGDTVYGNETKGTNGSRRDKFVATLSAGTKDETLATTTFTIRCNNSAGYKLSAQGMGGTEEVSGKTLQAGKLVNLKDGTTAIDSTTGSKSSWNSNDDASFWNFKVSAQTGLTVASQFDAEHLIPTEETEIVRKAAKGNVKTGETVTVTYGAGINIDQTAGTYVGRVMYTLAQMDTGNPINDAKGNTEENQSKNGGNGDNVNETNTTGNTTEKDEGTKDAKGTNSEGGTNDDEINALKTQVKSLSDRLNSMSAQSPTVVNNYYTTGSNGGASGPVETPVSDIPNPESNTNGDANESINGSLTSAKGALSKSGGSSAAKEVESSDNTGMIVALVAVGAAAAAATGAYLYTKNQED